VFWDAAVNREVSDPESFGGRLTRRRTGTWKREVKRANFDAVTRVVTPDDQCAVLTTRAVTVPAAGADGPQLLSNPAASAASQGATT
jgi:hypothetical protein